MKKLALLWGLLFSLVLVACPLDFSHLMTLCVELDKKEIFLGEKIKLEATINNTYFQNGESNFVFYVENYPSNYQILKGKLYEPLTSEKKLCISPKYVNQKTGVVEIQMEFSEPGEYTIKVNGTGKDFQEIAEIWNDEKYVYTILVK